MSTETTTGEVSYTRVHAASPDLLFDCMTMPEHLTHFWGPKGSTTAVEDITVDLRVGGAFETVMRDSEGGTHHMKAVWVEIDRPHRLVFRETEMGLTNTVTFVDLGDGRTEVTTHQTDVPLEYLVPEAQEGFQSSLDRCDEYVRSLVG